MTEEDIRRIVRETMREEFPDKVLSASGQVALHGRCSKKMIGDVVGQALLYSPIVVVDARGVRAVAGTKTKWS